MPLANFGGGISMISDHDRICLLQLAALIKIGIVAFSAVVFFQLVNLPVEFDASSRAKASSIRSALSRGKSRSMFATS